MLPKCLLEIENLPFFEMSCNPVYWYLVFNLVCSGVDIVIHPPEGDPPASWWDEECDKSLLIGVYKYGKCS